MQISVRMGMKQPYECKPSVNTLTYKAYSKLLVSGKLIEE